MICTNNNNSETKIRTPHQTHTKSSGHTRFTIAYAKKNDFFRSGQLFIFFEEAP